MQSNNSIVHLLLILCISSIQCNDDLVGGYRDIDSESVKPLLEESLNKLKGQENGADLRLTKIISARSQVVAGILYDIRAEFATNDQMPTKSCNISLLHQPWLRSHETQFECDDATKYKVTIVNKEKTKVKRALVGGPSDVEPGEVEELRQKINSSFVQLMSEGKNQLELKEVLGAKKKVVAGVLYTVDAVIQTSDGLKTSEIEVWEKPWIDFRQVSVKLSTGESYQIVKDNRPKRTTVNQPFPTAEDENASSLDKTKSLFIKFKEDFNRKYETSEEEAMRYGVFKNNLYVVEQLNKFEQGTGVYGITDFIDLTQQEYFQRTGLRNDLSRSSNDIANPLAEIPDIDLPTSFDWREKNAVTPVKNQGNCGSCWAFSVTGNIEGLNAVQNANLLSFSEQELVDCDKLDSGCNGGLPDNAYKSIETIGGLELENEYPYTAHQSKSCNFNKTMSHVRVSGAIDFKEKDEDGMAKWLTLNGPISIGINANAMQFYRGGISHPWKVLCSASSIDHGVLIVGFGVSKYPKFNKTLPYWIVKNSWGPK